MGQTFLMQGKHLLIKWVGKREDDNTGFYIIAGQTEEYKHYRPLSPL